MMSWSLRFVIYSMETVIQFDKIVAKARSKVRIQVQSSCPKAQETWTRAKLVVRIDQGGWGLGWRTR